MEKGKASKAMKIKPGTSKGGLDPSGHNEEGEDGPFDSGMRMGGTDSGKKRAGRAGSETPGPGYYADGILGITDEMEKEKLGEGRVRKWKNKSSWCTIGATAPMTGKEVLYI